MKSAEIIALEHDFNVKTIQNYIEKLLSKNEVGACNLKLLLIGGQSKLSANLYILCLNPLFPDRKLYRMGVKCVTQHYERAFPHAKTLNMLQSYLAYREAKNVGAYDALAINKKGNISEGTRTNFFAIRDKTIFSPPEKDILLGVTRDHVLKVAKKNGFNIAEQDINLIDLEKYDGFFLTSTSTKIMPISQIDDKSIAIPDELRELILRFEEFLAQLS